MTAAYDASDVVVDDDNSDVVVVVVAWTEERSHIPVSAGQPRQTPATGGIPTSVLAVALHSGLLRSECD